MFNHEAFLPSAVGIFNMRREAVVRSGLRLPFVQGNAQGAAAARWRHQRERDRCLRADAGMQPDPGYETAVTQARDTQNATFILFGSERHAVATRSQLPAVEISVVAVCQAQAELEPGGARIHQPGGPSLL